MCKNHLIAGNRKRRGVLSKLRGGGGFTLTELLATTMIMVMVVGIISQTLVDAISYSQSQIWRARAQSLCNLLVDSVENALLYADKVGVDDTDGTVSYPWYEINSGGKPVRYTIEENTLKQLIIQQSSTENPPPSYSLLNSQSYKQAEAAITAEKIPENPENSNLPEMLKITITVSPEFAGQGKNSVSNTFYVRPMKGDFAFATPEDGGGGGE